MSEKDTKVSVPLHPNALKACLEAAAKNDYRYYFNTVFVEPKHKQQRVHYTGCNDHILFTCWADRAGSLISQYVEPFMIHRDVVREISKSKSDTVTTVQVSSEDQSNHYEAQISDNQRITIRPVAGEFPDYKKLLPNPSDLTHKEAHYDPMYLGKFARAINIFRGTAVNGPSSYHCPVVMQVKEDKLLSSRQGMVFFKTDCALGLIMPFTEPDIAKNQEHVEKVLEIAKE